MIYHWSAFTIGAVLVEIPYNIVAGTIYFVTWYFPTGFPRDSFSIGYTWLLLMIFELYYTSFGQAIAAFSANELLASLLVPVFFLFIVAFCGVVVPYVSIPAFWRFVYWLSPFHYMVEGMLGALAHDVPVRCARQEFATFPLPEGSTCESYAGAFVRQAGGYIQQIGSECRYCQSSSGDEFVCFLTLLPFPTLVE
jgi:ABC-type multidrug transport system permease subunit